MAEELYFTNECPSKELEPQEEEEIISALCKGLQKTTSIEICKKGTSGAGLYVGLGGVALALLELGNVTNELRRGRLCNLLPLASETSRLMAVASEYVEACMGKDMMPGPERITILEGRGGVYALQAILQHKMGNEKGCAEAIKELDAMYEKEVQAKAGYSECEVTYGRAGYLCALVLAAKVTGHKPKAAILKSLTKEILIEGRKGAAEITVEVDGKKTTPIELGFPLMYTWNDEAYLGAGHGLCGILYCLLAGMEVLPPDELEPGMLEDIIGCLHALQQSCLPSGNLPIKLGDTTDRLVHLCHGAPGLLLLLCKCQEVLGGEAEAGGAAAGQGSPQKKRKTRHAAPAANTEAALAAAQMPPTHEYLEQALKLSELVWQRGLSKKGVGLCHGITGNAYCFLACHRAAAAAGMEDVALEQLHRATRFALFVARKCDELYEKADHPMSLYEGMTGAMALWSHLLPCFREDRSGNRIMGRMPGYEL